MIILCISQNCL